MDIEALRAGGSGGASSTVYFVDPLSVTKAAANGIRMETMRNSELSLQPFAVAVMYV